MRCVLFGVRETASRRSTLQGALHDVAGCRARRREQQEVVDQPHQRAGQPPRAASPPPCAPAAPLAPSCTPPPPPPGDVLQQPQQPPGSEGASRLRRRPQHVAADMLRGMRHPLCDSPSVACSRRPQTAQLPQAASSLHAQMVRLAPPANGQSALRGRTTRAGRGGKHPELRLRRRRCPRRRAARRRPPARRLGGGAAAAGAAGAASPGPPGTRSTSASTERCPARGHPTVSETGRLPR